MTWNNSEPSPTQNISSGQATILNNFQFLGNSVGNVTPGYYKFPNGLIIQWGSILMDTSGNKNQAYAIPFTTQVFHLSYSLAFNSSAEALTFNAGVGNCVDKNSGTLSLTSAVIRMSTNAPGEQPTAYWVAIGI